MVDRAAADKKFNIKLHIKMLRIKVEQQMPVFVVWSRGQKQAKTKSRLLSETMEVAVLDEKFEISTVLQVNDEGKPTKSKMSRLTVMSKQTGQLGEADLDMTKFGIDEPNILKLSLEKCSDADAYIEIGLQAEELAMEGTEGRGSIVNRKGPQMSNEEIDQKILAIKEEIDRYKKELKKVKQEADAKKAALDDQINSLGTSLENTKTDLQFN